MCRQDIEAADHDGEPDRRAYPPCRRRAADKRNEIAASQFSEALLAAQHLTRCPQNILHGRPLRTVLIAPSLRLAHGPLEDGRKRPDERSTQPTYFSPARHHRSRRALSAATSAARSAAGPSRARSRWRWPPSAGRY